VVNLEHAADIIANNLVEFAAKRTRRGGGFAAEELDLITAMHAELVDSLSMACAAGSAAGQRIRRHDGLRGLFPTAAR
jgi:Na+/phosphate symporter